MRESQTSHFGLVLAFAGLLWATVADGQITWRKTYGGFGIDVGHSIKQTLDGGYLALGTTGSFGLGSSDFYLVKLDADGNREWSSTYGTPSIEQGWSIAQGVNGYALAGFTSGIGGGYDGMVVLIDDQGVEQWRRTYGSIDWDFIYAVAAYSDGYYLAGQTFSGAENGEEWLIRADLNGDTIWTRTFGTSYGDVARDVKTTSDGGCIVSGTIGTVDGTTDAILTKFSSSGDEEWYAVLGGLSNEIGYGVTPTNDGGYVLGGTTESFSQNKEMFLSKVDADGTFLWSQHIGQIADWEGRQVGERDDGSLMLVGYTEAYGGGGKDAYLLFTDSAGDFLFGRTFGGENNDEGWAFDRTFDGGVVVVGGNKSSGPGIEGMYVIKSDDQGMTPDPTDYSYFDPLPVLELTKPTGATISPTLISSGQEMHIKTQGRGTALARISDMRGATQVLLPIETGTRTSIRIPDLAPGPYLISVEQ
ncbi:MAG TPA: hypothetical protein PLC10_15255, partial [Flavobacteriales bacterium]|nr:hypothetical protein [Flavobacteriales bacterium]